MRKWGRLCRPDTRGNRFEGIRPRSGRAGPSRVARNLDREGESCREMNRLVNCADACGAVGVASGFGTLPPDRRHSRSRDTTAASGAWRSAPTAAASLPAATFIRSRSGTPGTSEGTVATSTEPRLGRSSVGGSTVRWTGVQCRYRPSPIGKVAVSASIGGAIMEKAKTTGAKVPARTNEIRHARLDLSDADCQRLQRVISS